MSKEELIAFWKKQYLYCAKSVKEYDAGKAQVPTTIQAFGVGAREDARIEANYAAGKLLDFGVKVPEIK